MPPLPVIDLTADNGRDAMQRKRTIDLMDDAENDDNPHELLQPPPKRRGGKLRATDKLQRTVRILLYLLWISLIQLLT
jgi:hypothetical protein